MNPHLFAVGDIQGCLPSLLELVANIDHIKSGDPERGGRDSARTDNTRTSTDGADAAPLWLVGDLVNRGPDSLGVLRWAIANQHRLNVVLGNHDLHLLAVAAGVRPAHRADTLDDILAAPDAAELIDWVRTRPLAHYEDGHLMVHAGVLPQWDAQLTLELAGEVQQALAGPRWIDFLRVMYGNEPARWDSSLAGANRLRLIVNALTRLRFCTPDGQMEFKAKLGPHQPPPGYLPWFEVPERASRDVTVVFGHWSTLGLMLRPNLIALDTGCVWGGSLTAIRLADRRCLQLACPQAQPPGQD